MANQPRNVPEPAASVGRRAFLVYACRVASAPAMATACRSVRNDAPRELTDAGAAPPVTLSDQLRKHLKDDRFGLVTSIRGLPLGVREGLQKLFGSQTLDIAEPGAEFQLTDVDTKLPSRRLTVAGCSTDHCLVYYERGRGARTWHVALFHWTPELTRFEVGGLAPSGLVNVDDVLNAIQSGAIKAANQF